MPGFRIEVAAYPKKAGLAAAAKKERQSVVKAEELKLPAGLATAIDKLVAAFRGAIDAGVLGEPPYHLMVKGSYPSAEEPVTTPTISISVAGTPPERAQ